MIRNPLSASIPGASAQTFDGLLRTGAGVVGFKEDFTGGASQTITAAAAIAFDNSWSAAQIVGGTQTIQVRDGTWANPGQIQMITSAISGQGLSLWRGGGGASAGPLGNLAAQGGWEINIIMSITSTALVAIRAGICAGSAQVSDAPASGIWVRYDTAAADANFTYECRSATVSTTSASSVAADTNFHRMRIRSAVAGTILFSMDNGAETAISSNVPTATMSPFIQVISRTTAAKTAYIDFYSYYATNTRA